MLQYCYFKQKRSKLAHPISNIELVLKNDSFEKVVINKIPFNPRKKYYVLTHDYVQHGKDGMSFFMDPLSIYNTQYKVRDVLTDYLST